MLLLFVVPIHLKSFLTIAFVDLEDGNFRVSWDAHPVPTPSSVSLFVKFIQFLVFTMYFKWTSASKKQLHADAGALHDAKLTLPTTMQNLPFQVQPTSQAAFLLPLLHNAQPILPIV